MPRCFEAVEATDTSAWHLLLEDLTDSRVDMHIVRLGLNYQFNWYETVVAKY